MSCDIRLAVESDIPLILAFIVELAEYEKLAHEVMATEALLRQSLFGDTQYAEVIIAEVNNEPAGFALFFHNYSAFLAKPGLYLEDLFVKPAMRGMGIGKKLFKFLAQLAIDRGCGRMEWWVLDWNAPAIEFYRRLNAEPMDEWTVFRLTADNLTKLTS